MTTKKGRKRTRKKKDGHKPDFKEGRKRRRNKRKDLCVKSKKKGQKSKD